MEGKQILYAEIIANKVVDSLLKNNIMDCCATLTLRRLMIISIGYFFYSDSWQDEV